jgi:REP element-mobilizing transposase RayT
VPHLSRQSFDRQDPVHVTLRLQQGLGYLRDQRRTNLIEDTLRIAKERFGVRVVHYSIQGSHLHLIVEAEGAPSLSKGMQGLCIRLARRLNKLCRRRGPVFVDRYHAHVLDSRSEVINAVRYVLDNYRHHVRGWEYAHAEFDPCSSAAWGFGENAPRVSPRSPVLRFVSGLPAPPRRLSGQRSLWPR